jgi:hypothetical protein
MMIDRRDLIAGAALVAVAPTLEWLPPALSQPGVNSSYPVLLIDGWNVEDDSDATNQVWIRVDRSWRVAWR